MDKRESKYKGTFIPAEVLVMPGLRLLEKVVLADVTQFSDTGYYIGNGGLACRHCAFWRGVIYAGYKGANSLRTYLSKEIYRIKKGADSQEHNANDGRTNNHHYRQTF